jgi:hypothetical protein
MTDEQAVREILAKLDDCRALHDPLERDDPDWVEEAIVEIEHDVSVALSKVTDGSVAGEWFGLMRSACCEFLTTADRVKLRGHRRPWTDYWLALGKLRGVLGVAVVRLGRRSH